MEDRPKPTGGLRHPPRTRLLLSLLLAGHLGVLAVWFLPADPDMLAVFPGAVRAPLEATLPPFVVAVSPLTRRYLDLTATRQHWTLFAPHPANWEVSLEAVAYYPVEPAAVGDHGSPRVAASAPPSPDGSRAAAWRADTVRIDGPRERGYPHLAHHRFYRVLYNMGYEGWGEAYRPFFALGLCRTLRDATGTPPSGLRLTAHWYRIRAPLDPEPPETYEQFLIGYTCPAPEEGP